MTIKMRAITGFSTTVHGNIGVGDVFTVTSKEYAKMLADNNLAATLAPAPAPEPVTTEPAPKPVTTEPAPKPVKRTRRRRRGAE